MRNINDMLDSLHCNQCDNTFWSMKNDEISPPDRTRLQSRSHAERPPKLRLITLEDLDGRTIAARRARELIESIATDLGGHDMMSEATKQLVMRAAILSVFLESTETKWLAGEQVELDSYLAAVDRQRRILTTLGLERRTRDAHLPLRERIAGAAR
jgi:hypothetical protein